MTIMNNKIQIHGVCEPRFKDVKDAFRRNFEKGLEVGASFAVMINGKFVIDLWGDLQLQRIVRM